VSLDVAALVPDPLRPLLRRTPQPEWVPPMLATLTERRFSDPEWIFERKLDGVRCLAFRRGSGVRLLSRNRESANSSYPEIVDALAEQELDEFVIDGEIVAFDHGRTSFERLQHRMHVRDPERARRTGVAVFLYAFDVVHAGGYDCSSLPLRQRKALLRAALRTGGPLRFSSHRNTDGEALYEEACRKGWEGLIAKRAESTYQGRRSPDWLKFKCVNEQEFVIVGYTDPKGSREAFGALLLGYHEGGRLRYGGKVGTGFNRALLADLLQRMRPLERDAPPVSEQRGLPRLGVHWVEPRLVCQVGFAEWTDDGQLRHPRFLGLREDKDASEVVRERPART
jgi:bifunctional non-homologous end joining protein LigD